MGPEETTCSLEGDAAPRTFQPETPASECARSAKTRCPVMRVTDLFGGPKYSGPQARSAFKGTGRWWINASTTVPRAFFCSLVSGGVRSRNHSPPSHRDEGKLAFILGNRLIIAA